MPRRFQFTLKWLFVAMLVVAAFFGGVFVSRRHETELRDALRAEKEGHAKTASMLRGVVGDLEEARGRIKELEISGDKRGTIPGVIRRSDGTFFRMAENPDGSWYEEDIPLIE